MKGFYFDEHIPLTVAVPLLDGQFVVVTAHGRGMLGRSDADHLHLAGAEGLCLVTRNRDDFVSLAERAWEEQDPHAGILIVPSSFGEREIGPLARALVSFAMAHPEDLWPYGLWWLRRLEEDG